MKVFISHAEKDRDFARELASTLSAAGFETWFDNLVVPGENIHQAFAQALERSQAMIVLLSPDSMESEWVRAEIQYALGSRDYQGRIIPVLLQPTEQIPWILKKFSIIPATTDEPGARDRLADEVIDRLRAAEVAGS